MILTLQELGVDDRDIHLFDTFEGMTAPTEHDVSALDPPALETWESAQQAESRAVERALRSSDASTEEAVRVDAARHRLPGRPAALRHRGPVEETLPSAAPDRSRSCGSTPTGTSRRAAELEHLYPRRGAGGVLIVDDYGHWEGAGAPSTSTSRPSHRHCCSTGSTTPAAWPSRPDTAAATPRAAQRAEAERGRALEPVARPWGRAPVTRVERTCSRVAAGGATACCRPGPRSGGSPGSARASPALRGRPSSTAHAKSRLFIAVPARVQGQAGCREVRR